MKRASPMILSLALVAARADAQCASTGPDLIVGDLTGINVFSNTGGVVALMPGVSLCNVGSASAGWSSTSAAHPAIVFTLYRFAVVGGVGRFEAIGQSWVHHQSSALQQSLCCTCTPAGLNQLGPGCSTTSTASAVGTQANLGQRGLVDPVTGTLTWPLGNPAPGSTAERRLQVAAVDLGLPGARYFLEAQIVAADDAAAGNRANDASYREVTVGAGPTFLYAGPVVRGSPAIEAWPTLDPNAVVAPSAVPGEGATLRTGSAVTDLGDGFHAYEYALHDLDSLAGVRSFSVPIPLGVAVRNVGFRDVATHSGDPVSDADWSVTQSSGRVTWSTTSFATDPLANGLRWGTTFRFGFEASAPPVAGSIELARFRPGAPDTWTVSAFVPGDIGGGGAFCFGDGSGTACPCGNASLVGAGVGCLNSLGTGGRLVRGGNASIANDTLTLFGSAMPNSSALYFQGTATQSGGAGAVFGDGLRCVAGSVIRLGTKLNAVGASTWPGSGDGAISAATGAAAGDTRHFQVWYRNSAAFCTASTFNLTSGASVTWSP